MRQHIQNSEIWSICGVESESIIHTLRDPVIARSIWAQLLPQSQLYNFFSMGLKDWFVCNLTNKGAIEHEANWECVFGIAIWRLWFWRNYYMFCENAWQGNKMVDILRRAHEVIITLGRMGQLTG